MRQIIFVFCLLFSGIQSVNAQSSCLPEGISFYNQTQIDNFPSMYPGCAVIEGYVNIDTRNASNVDSLIQITLIQGDLQMSENNITDLTGFANLTGIYGNAWFSENSFSSFHGMDSLGFIGGTLGVSESHGLDSLDGLQNLTLIGGDLDLEDNLNLVNIDALSGLDSLGGSLLLEDLPRLQHLDALLGRETIYGALVVDGLDSLLNLNGLLSIQHVESTLKIRKNVLLPTLEGLANIQSINGELILAQNDALTSLTGIDSISPTSITDLTLLNNENLNSCSLGNICSYLTNNIGPATIELNAEGCNTENEITDACAPVGINDMAAEATIEIYPNPSAGELTIQWLGSKETHDVILIDSWGRESMRFNNVANGSVLDLDVAPGFYTLALKTAHEFSTQKLQVLR
jgi:hypothetical protein